MVALAVALFDLPYVYYVLLRFVVAGSSVLIMSAEIERGRPAWAWTFAVLALIYNPIIPVHLDREIWSLINVASIWIFAAHMWRAVQY
jgi:hypothetical protein